ncbi:hypothetical protein [Sorangium sp. So ce1335]|uniref:hypothetical protein n=1 Tax=Sorangium sp. So ce1335 TaxID=3133335 RepID=UPI003F5FFFEF
MTLAHASARRCDDPRERGGVGGVPPLHVMAELLRWEPAEVDPLAWRDAFEEHLARRAAAAFARSDPEGSLAQGLALLPERRRRRFLRAPAVAMLLRRDVADPFDGRLFSELLLAELASAGLATELPGSLWTARGDRLLDPSAPERWTAPGPPLGDTGITLDEGSPFPFPDDEFGIAVTVPHDRRELAIAIGRVVDGLAALRRACAPALEIVTASTEVLALRREPAGATAFQSSTFAPCAGLVRLTNAHLPDVDMTAVVEALVHEAIHCLLHVHEELDQPFLNAPEANRATVTSPWTGATIRLHSYVHACAVWYGVYWLWSTEGLVADCAPGRAEALRRRARRGFRQRPVGAGLAPFRHLLTEGVRQLLDEIEARMLSLA